MPALLTSTSTPPRLFWTAVTALSTAGGEATSHSRNSALPPVSRIEFAVFSPAARSRSNIATAAPSSARQRAVASPIPIAPPETIADLFSKLMLMSVLTRGAFGHSRSDLRLCRDADRRHFKRTQRHFHSPSPGCKLGLLVFQAATTPCFHDLEKPAGKANTPVFSRSLFETQNGSLAILGRLPGHQHDIRTHGLEQTCLVSGQHTRSECRAQLIRFQCGHRLPARVG